MGQPMLFDDHGHAHYPARTPGGKGGEFAPKPGSPSWVEAVSARLPGEVRRSHRQYRIKGVNDEQDTCDECGKTNLRRTVILAPLDDEGNEDGECRVGVDCAAKMMRTTTVKVKNQVAEQSTRLDREADDARERLDFWEPVLAQGRDAAVREFRARNPRWPGWQTGDDPYQSILDLVAELRGRVAARDAFRAGRRR
jgi:hypothetical protein